jgi:hypothetical protein
METDGSLPCSQKPSTGPYPEQDRSQWGYMYVILSPYRGEKFCAPLRPGDLCWCERQLLVVPPMPDRSKGRGQTKCGLWSFRLGFRCGTNDPLRDIFTVTKPPETYGGGRWRRLRRAQGCSASKYIYTIRIKWHKRDSNSYHAMHNIYAHCICVALVHFWLNRLHNSLKNTTLLPTPGLGNPGCHFSASQGQELENKDESEPCWPRESHSLPQR